MKTLDEALAYFSSPDGETVKPEWFSYDQSLQEVASNPEVVVMAMTILMDNLHDPLLALRKAIAMGVMVGMEMEKL